MSVAQTCQLVFNTCRKSTTAQLHKIGSGKGKNQTTDRRWGNHSIKNNANINQWRPGFRGRWEYCFICLTWMMQFFMQLYMGQRLKNGSSKICGRQPLKNLKRYGLSKQLENTSTKHFLCGLLFSRSRFLFDKKREKFVEKIYLRILSKQLLQWILSDWKQTISL